MGNFIKLHEYIINLDNVDYIDTDSSADEIEVDFKSGSTLTLNKNKKVKDTLNSLLNQNKPKDNSNCHE